MIFTWSFLAFHDIPGLGKYGFSCSVTVELVTNIWQLVIDSAKKSKIVFPQIKQVCIISKHNRF